MKRIFRLTERPGDRQRDVADEFRFHIEMRTRELIAQGLSREEALVAARAAFGDVEALTAESVGVRAVRDRERSRHRALQGLMLDVRFSMRGLRKNPGFALSALLTLALGIGATTAVFTVLNGVLLRPLPYTNHARLVSIWTTAVIGGEPQRELPFSAANFVDLRSRARGTSLDDMAAFRSWGFVLGGAGRAELLPGATVTGGFFPTLGVAPLLGRALDERDAAVGAADVVVIGHDLWQRRFAGDRSVPGTSVLLNGRRYTIVGVMPPGFEFPRGAELPSGFQFPPRTEVWAAYPMTAENLATRGTFNMAVIGLLARGGTAPKAEAEVSAAMRAIGDANGLASVSLGGRLLPMRDQAVAAVRSGLLLIFGAVALVLLIACANVSNLLLARTAGRQRELAIRSAIGAGRWRITRQLITENLVLALGGGAVGLTLAVVGKEWLLTLVPDSLPRFADISLDATVLATALGVAASAGIAFGIVAATHATRRGSPLTLRSSVGSAGSSGQSRFRRSLIVVEVALSLVLLAGAAALIEGFVRLQRVAPGFDPRGVIAAQLLIPSTGALSFRDEGPRWGALFTRYVDQVRSIPGVEAAGVVSSLPLSGAWESSSYGVEGRPQPQAERPQAHYAIASADYFRAMGMPLREGRSFGASDLAGAPAVVIVSRSLADATWPGERAIGKRIRLFSDDPMEVVGVVADVRQTSLGTTGGPTIYIPVTQLAYPGMSLVVKTSGDPSAVVPALRRELAAIDPLLPLEGVRTMQQVMDASLAQRRFGVRLLGFFAASALALVVVGLYGVIAYAVSQRMREIAVRLALGATRRDVFGLLILEGVRLTAVGVALGLGGAVALSQALGRTMPDVSVLQPMTLGSATALLVLVALSASAFPARRAMRVEAAEALRGE